MIKTIRRTRRYRLVAMASLAALVFSACGDDDDDGAAPDVTEAPATEETAAPDVTEAPDDTEAPGTDDTEAPETDDTEAPAPEGSPVLVAVTIDLTGPSPTDDSGPAVIEAWADHVNAIGGIDGHPVEVEIRDTRGDAAAALAATEELLALEPVLFVLNSPSTEAAQADTLAAAEVPIMGVGYQPSVWGGFIGALNLTCSLEADAQFPCGLPNAFAVTTTFGAVVDEQVLGAQAAGATHLAVAACAEVDSCAAADPVFQATAGQLGVESDPAVRVSSTATDYSAECIQWIQDGVDFIQISGSSAMGVNLIASCTDQGYEGIWGASAGSVSGELIQVEGITLAGGLNAFPWFVDDPLVQEYRDAMAAGGIDEAGWSSPTATGLWSALQLFAKAQEAGLSDAPTGVETLANMFTVENETLGGLIAPITISDDLTTRTRDCFWPYILEDGEFTNPLGGLTYQCSPAES